MKRELAHPAAIGPPATPGPPTVRTAMPSDAGAGTPDGLLPPGDVLDKPASRLVFPGPGRTAAGAHGPRTGVGLAPQESPKMTETIDAHMPDPYFLNG
ncbi:hypothetical protein ACWEO4_23615 [Streptomyces sp. NPDC004393]|uniref:hypothetical protein n=1 Tax=Streptomyces sp. NPDC004533 TaxID=3154278 RepID=UPI0033AB0B47